MRSNSRDICLFISIIFSFASVAISLKLSDCFDNSEISPIDYLKYIKKTLLIIIGFLKFLAKSSYSI